MFHMSCFSNQCKLFELHTRKVADARDEHLLSTYYVRDILPLCPHISLQEKNQNLCFLGGKQTQIV